MRLVKIEKNQGKARVAAAVGNLLLSYLTGG